MLVRETRCNGHNNPEPSRRVQRDALRMFETDWDEGMGRYATYHKRIHLLATNTQQRSKSRR